MYSSLQNNVTLGPRTLPVPSSHTGPHRFGHDAPETGAVGATSCFRMDAVRTTGTVQVRDPRSYAVRHVVVAPGSRHVFRNPRGGGRAASFTVRKERRGGVDAWSIRLGGPTMGAWATGSVYYTNVPLQFSTATTAAAQDYRKSAGILSRTIRRESPNSYENPSQSSSGGSPSSFTTSPSSSTVTTPRLFTAYGSRPISSMNPL